MLHSSIRAYKKAHLKRPNFIMKGKQFFPNIQATQHTEKATIGEERQRRKEGRRRRMEQEQTNEEGISYVAPPPWPAE